MKWYNESVECKEKPGNVAMSLVGYYNDDPKKHTITIELVIEEYEDARQESFLACSNNHPKLSSIVLFEQSPASLIREVPLAEDVFNKYKSKILRFLQQIRNKEYSELVKK